MQLKRSHRPIWSGNEDGSNALVTKNTKEDKKWVCMPVHTHTHSDMSLCGCVYVCLCDCMCASAWVWVWVCVHFRPLKGMYLRVHSSKYIYHWCPIQTINNSEFMFTELSIIIACKWYLNIWDFSTVLLYLVSKLLLCYYLCPLDILIFIKEDFQNNNCS